MATTKISIIIPCYNMGNFLLEAIESVEKVYDPAIHEVIIVDDGSNESLTLEIIAGIKKHRVITQKNGGLANARNTGISNSKGKYLLFLDADNLLTNGYLSVGAEILDQNAKVDIVYGESEMFGDTTGFLPTRPFNLQTLMSYNYIDACCLIRKTLLEELGGFDEKMPVQGLEDWELWLRASFKGKQFYYLNGTIVQKYRVRGRSMIGIVGKKKRDSVYDYLEKKYPKHLSFTNLSDFYYKKFEAQTLGWTAKLFIKKYFPSFYEKLVVNGKFSRYL